MSAERMLQEKLGQSLLRARLLTLRLEHFWVQASRPLPDRVHRDEAGPESCEHQSWRYSVFLFAFLFQNSCTVL